jgi:hypothetical protein
MYVGPFGRAMTHAQLSTPMFSAITLPPMQHQRRSQSPNSASESPEKRVAYPVDSFPRCSLLSIGESRVASREAYSSSMHD